MASVIVQTSRTIDYWLFLSLPPPFTVLLISGSAFIAFGKLDRTLIVAFVILTTGYGNFFYGLRQIEFHLF